MAAVFLTYTGKDIFLPNVTFSVPYGCAQLSTILDNSDSLILVTDVSAQTSEIMQYFVGFDDLITSLHFGKGVGAININGVIFCDCNGSLPGLSSFYQTVGSLRGKNVTLSLGGYSFTGPVATTSVQLTANPDTMAYFSIQMNMISHTLPGGPNTDNTATNTPGPDNLGTGGPNIGQQAVGFTSPNI